MTLNYLGYMLGDRGVKLDEALTMVQKAVQLDPQNGAYLDSLGWVYFKMGQYALAEANLRKATERMGNDPAVHDHLGELYEKTGRLKMAASQWEQSLQEYARTVPADAEPGDVSKVQKKLDSARVKLAKEESAGASPKQ
jgi:tetratricopeptide (TPR) repeat protein